MSVPTLMLSDPVHSTFGFSCSFCLCSFHEFPSGKFLLLRKIALHHMRAP